MDLLGRIVRLLCASGLGLRVGGAAQGVLKKNVPFPKELPKSQLRGMLLARMLPQTSVTRGACPPPSLLIRNCIPLESTHCRTRLQPRQFFLWQRAVCGIAFVAVHAADDCSAATPPLELCRRGNGCVKGLRSSGGHRGKATQQKGEPPCS